MNLDEHLEAEYEATESFRIDGPGTEAWAMRKYRRALTEIQRIRDAANAERQRITDWETDALKGPQHDAGYFEALLIQRRHELERDNPDLPKTYRVPGGALVRRKLPDRIEVVDPDAFLAWAQVNAPDAVKVTPLVSALSGLPRTDGGDLVASDGEVVPGVGVSAGGESYSVKVDK